MKKSTGDWYVYLLRCVDATLYCGITLNIEERVEKHNKGKASRYTRGRTPVELVYYEKQPNRSLATRREIQIKKMTLIEKEKLILDRS